MRRIAEAIVAAEEQARIVAEAIREANPLPEGIHTEFRVTVSGDYEEVSDLPFKWFHVDVFNKGPDAVKVMLNNVDIGSAITLEEGEGREFDAKRPKYGTVFLYNEPGKTSDVRVTTTR